MPSDLNDLCATARERIVAPPFPRAQIMTAAQRSPESNPRLHRLSAAIIAGISIIAIAAAAELATQSKIRFTPSGGMVLSSSAASSFSREIHSSEDVRQAASHLNFPAVVPSGLPAGSKPTRLYTSGPDLMAVTYDLPGAWRASHHFAWIFLANPATLSGSKLPAVHYTLRTDGRMSTARWRAGSEEVIVVSNGLTPGEVDTIKRAMQP